MTYLDKQLKERVANAKSTNGQSASAKTATAGAKAVAQPNGAITSHKICLFVAD